MRTLKLSTARTIVVFMTDSADHVSGKPSLTLTITASKNGAAFASVTPTVTELASGWYAVALTAAHTDTLGDLALHITAAGADPTDLICQVVAVDFADATNLGLGNLDTNVGSRQAAGNVTVGGYAAGQVPLQPTVAGRTLDVTANGNAGIDWGNIDNNTTVVALSGTTVLAVTNAVTVGSINANAVNASALATDAVTEIAAGILGTIVPGAFGAGTLGYLVGTNLDAQSSAIKTNVDATNSLVTTALPNHAPGGSNGLMILGTNTAGVTLQPIGGDVLKLTTASGYAINATGSTGSRLVATGLGSAALTCTPGTGGVGIVSDIQGDLLGNANILYQTAIVTAATANTVTLSSPVSGPPSTTPGAYVGGVFWVKTGTGSRQVRTITAYDSVNRVVTVDRPWDTVPDATSVGQILTGQEYAANAAAAGDAMALTPAERESIAAAVWGAVIVSTRTAGYLLRKMASMLLGTSNGAGTASEKYDEIDAAGTTAVTVVADGSGNRSGMTYTP